MLDPLRDISIESGLDFLARRHTFMGRLPCMYHLVRDSQHLCGQVVWRERVLACFWQGSTDRNCFHVHVHHK